MIQIIPSPRAPMKHQLEIFERTKDERVWSNNVEQRGGKTKSVIDISSYSYQLGRIDAVIVIAWPNGVQNVWVEEWPKDWPAELPCKVVAWRSGKMATTQAQEHLENLLVYRGMAVLAMNCEALLTTVAWRYLSRFLRRRKVMIVADEASWAKSPNSARTKRLLALGRQPNVVMKRILDGTPADEGPLDLYAPCAFLDPALLGFRSFFAFKARYAKLEEGYGAGGRTFKRVVGYQNLDELTTKLKRFSSRVRRADISDAPPKTYQTRYFVMSDKQRRVYDRLRDEYVAELTGGDVPVANVLTRMTRLQMIARNYYPPENIGVACPICLGSPDAPECETCGSFGIVVETTSLQRIDPEHNPAQEALTAELVAARKPTIIWARFRQDVTDALTASATAGRRAVRFDGSVPTSEREAAYSAFRAGEADDIVATIASGLSRGRDLTRAGTLIYYSNDFSLRARRQSEDRAESLRRTYSTDVVDLVAEDTRDLDVISALREKRSLAEMIVGDPPERWL